MQRIKNLLLQSNIIVFIIVLFYSCSTDINPNPMRLVFNDIEIKEIPDNYRRFKVSKDLKSIEPMAVMAENFFEHLFFNPRIVKRLTFDFTIDTRDIVLAKIRQSEGVIILNADPYTPLWRFSSVVAYQENNHIYFNRLKLKRKSCNIVKSFVHEYLHRLGYSHGDNSPINKENSVPYYMSNLAYGLCLKGKL